MLLKMKSPTPTPRNKTQGFQSLENISRQSRKICRRPGNTYHSICQETIYSASPILTKVKTTISSWCSPSARKNLQTRTLRCMEPLKMRQSQSGTITCAGAHSKRPKPPKTKKISSLTSSASYHSGTTLGQQSAPMTAITLLHRLLLCLGPTVAARATRKRTSLKAMATRSLISARKVTNSSSAL